MRLLRAAREESATMPLVSLIDVVFLLLIYFLVTAQITPPESQLASGLRAERQGAGAGRDLQPQIVSVERQGDAEVFRVGGQIVTDGATLTRVLKPLPKEVGVFVRGSSSVRVDSIATALQSCKDAGFIKVSYVPAK
ncbi:MAG: ExbD/TolR family protein [Phycisphaerales bacterium]|nr:MAG: biopolymer transporter ExbD [Phycisphaerales bacterium]